MRLAIIIVTWNSANEILACLSSLASVSVEHEVWVVDNNSSDETVNKIRSTFPDVRLIVNDDNLGFARANNQAIEKSTSDLVLLLNPDTVVTDGAIERAVQEIEQRDEVGLLGVKMLNADGSVQASCFRFPTVWMNLAEQFSFYHAFPRKLRGAIFLSEFWDYSTSRPVDWVLGAFMLVKRSVIDKAGSVPEQYFMYGEDLDWCYQIRKAGYQVWFFPSASVTHLGNKSGEKRPAIWGIRKRAESKYVFCETSYGSFRARIIELIDLGAQTLRMGLYLVRSRRNANLKELLERVRLSHRVALDRFFRTR